MEALEKLAILWAAVIIDSLFGEPPRAIHPVVWMGKAIAAFERRRPRDKPWEELRYGALAIACTVPPFVLSTAWLLGHLRRRWPVAYWLAGAFLLKTAISPRELWQAVARVQSALAANELDVARKELRNLVSRDVTLLDEPLVAAAAIESLAENTNDGFVAPLFYYALWGVPGAIAYRLINTFDSMLGYHGEYEYIGKVPARLDDLLNLIPARLTGLGIVATSWLTNNDAAGAWRIMWRDHKNTESPNAGWSMSAMAGALGVRLEKVGHYILGAPNRPPDVASISRALKVARVATGLALVVTSLLLYAVVVPQKHTNGMKR